MYLIQPSRTEWVVPDGSKLSTYDEVVRVEATSSHVDDRAAGSTQFSVGGWYVGTRCYRTFERAVWATKGVSSPGVGISSPCYQRIHCKSTCRLEQSCKRDFFVLHSCTPAVLAPSSPASGSVTRSVEATHQLN